MADKLVTLQDENQQPIYPETRASVVKTSSGKTVEEVLGDAGISDAPKDGKTYGRNNGSWVETSQMEEAPTDGFAYARKNGAWAEVIESTETALLVNYTKPAAYTAISPTDSINEAIGKLEVGINGQSSGGSTSEDVYYLPSSLLSLKSTATHDQIVEAFGGSDKKKELNDAIKGNKKIYIQGDGSYGLTPAYCYSFLGISIYVLFFRSAPSLEFVTVSFALSSSCSVYNPTGYNIDSNINKLTSESSNEDISLVFGGLSKIKEIENALSSGNVIYTTTESSSTTTSRMLLSINLTFQNYIT